MKCTRCQFPAGPSETSREPGALILHFLLFLLLRLRHCQVGLERLQQPPGTTFGLAVTSELLKEKKKTAVVRWGACSQDLRCEGNVVQ